MKTISFLVFEDYKNMETRETTVKNNLEVSTTFSGFRNLASNINNSPLNWSTALSAFQVLFHILNVPINDGGEDLNPTATMEH